MHTTPKKVDSSQTWSLYGDNKIQGVLPVLHLPYHEDHTIHFEIWEKEIDWVFSHRVDGVVLAMVTEVIRLTDKERDELVQATVQHVAGRGPVVASVGAESTVQAIRHAEAAQDAGADALMAIPPGSIRCSADEIIRYYEAILSSTTLPLIVQDASGYLGNAIPIDTQAELFHRYPERVGFKPEAQPVGANLSALRDATQNKSAIYEGMGGVALIDSFHRGIAGTMPGADLCWAIVALWEALNAGDVDSARQIHALLASIISYAYCLDAYLALEKLFLVKQHIFENQLVRGPVGVRLDPETISLVTDLFHLLQQRVAEFHERKASHPVA